MYLGDRWSNKVGGSSGIGLNGRYPLTFDASGTPTINYLRCWHGLAAGGGRRKDWDYGLPLIGVAPRKGARRRVGG